MITELRLENFKGFGMAQTIPLSRITLLFGPNSSGKSSVLHSLLLLKQTLEETDTPSAVLLPKGRFVDLGSFSEMVYAHDRAREISFSLRFEGREMPHRISPERRRQMHARYWWMLDEDGVIENAKPRNTSPWLSFSVREHRRRHTVLTRLASGVGGWDEPICQYAEPSSPLPARLRLFDELPAVTLQTLNKDHRALRAHWPETQEFVSAVNRLLANSSPGDDHFRKHLSALAHEQRSAFPSGSGFMALRSALEHSGPEFLSSWLTQMRSYDWDAYVSDIEKRAAAFPLFLNHFLPRPNVPTQGTLPGGQFTPGVVVPDMSRFMAHVSKLATESLGAIVHLGPLREHPERHYIFSGTTVRDVGQSGKRAPDLLFSEPRLVRTVNAWLERFGINYDVKIVRIGRGDVFEVRLRDRDSGVKLASPDVGFGMSQVMPIIAQSLFSKESLILIEQPELHLHPRLQAELGSFFAECSNGTGTNQFIIETHSEHLLLRLQRLIRRRELQPSDVSVVFVEQTAEGSLARQIRLNDQGEFTDRWPGGFFEEGFQERFGD